MADLVETIASVRESVVAVMRTRVVRREKKGGKHGRTPEETVDCAVSFGSGFCVLEDRYVLTAFHVLNDGEAPDVEDHHYVFTVPGNQEAANQFPVVGIPVQQPELDMAVLEIGPCTTTGIHLPAMPVSSRLFEDGQRVLTLGFPAPEIHGLEIDPQGNCTGGNLFLKSHANEGIVAAHYQLNGLPVYELNVAWHNGESGGPIVALGDVPAAFSLMQQYRNVQTPHGIVPGPRRGLALSSLGEALAKLGIAEVSGVLAMGGQGPAPRDLGCDSR